MVHYYAGKQLVQRESTYLTTSRAGWYFWLWAWNPFLKRNDWSLYGPFMKRKTAVQALRKLVV